jgi:hypothetical protein
VTIDIFDTHLLVPSALHDPGIPAASLRSLLLICILRAAFACLHRCRRRAIIAC